MLNCIVLSQPVEEKAVPENGRSMRQVKSQSHLTCMQEKIQSCVVVQMKCAACESNRFNGVECDISVFFTVAFCSVVEFNRSLKELKHCFKPVCGKFGVPVRVKKRIPILD